MKSIANKIDFAGVVVVKNANPNGDPLNGNRPRLTYEGLGEISDVCLKRKIRNRILEKGHGIFVQSDDYKVDDYPSLSKRAEGELSKEATKDKTTLIQESCEKWFDVRAFGQLFAFSGKEKAKGVSVGIRGPVSIHSAFSVTPVNTSSLQITKSVSSEGDGTKRGSDTMGMKHRIDHGIYVFYGSINPQLATKTGFSREDADILKDALLNIFENDASSARPEGSMELNKLVWWEHDNPSGQYSSAKVHRSFKVTLAEGITEPKDIDDYDIQLEELEGLKAEMIDGK
ncbi:type I-C CRISPR-associated protein Cas7/Csd2 [Tindallia californiensis]|uniref:CRISPR-associated protein, Csd2 family n=1 Tax=Tindallia californiensis TaxID=159292 RepID=A0A1H3RAD0_9FIRM|nr:type I-C CRISPR-associated protein Cas7/Csd2 [Tindallia californiensis]SDZ22600.1 CRISPR-associated protein, Csd2 family [Tindallia californiensis]